MATLSRGTRVQLPATAGELQDVGHDLFSQAVKERHGFGKEK